MEKLSYAVLFLDLLMLSTQLYCGKEKNEDGETKNCQGKIDSFALWFNCKLECMSLWDTRAQFVIKKKGFITER